MPKPRTRVRLEHPIFKDVYCIERNGKIYTVIKGQNPVGTDLPWQPRNKVVVYEAERIMEKRRDEFYGIIRPKMLNEALAEFVSLKYPKLDHKTIVVYNSAFTTYFVKNLPLSDIEAIRRMILNQKHHVQSRKKVPHSDSTVILYLTKLHTFFDYCAQHDYIVKNNVITKIMMPDPPVREIRPFTWTEIETILKYYNDRDFYLPLLVKNKRGLKNHDKRCGYADMFLFYALTGIRGNEGLNMTWDKNILSDRIIVYGKRHRKNELRIREIPISLIPGLREHLQKMERNKYKFGGRLFRVATVGHLNILLKYAAEDTKIRIGTMHSLRKFAVNYWEKVLGIPETVCADLAGHTVVVRNNTYRTRITADEILHKVELVRFQYDSQVQINRK